MTFSISAKIQDGGQNLGNSTFFRRTTCNFSSIHRVQNLLVAGKRFLGKVASRYVCFFFIFTQKFKISHCSRDKYVFAFYAEIQEGHQKWRESYFCEMLTVNSPDTLRVKNFIKIARSRTVAKINEFLCFTLNFKIAVKNGRKAIFVKCRQYTLQISCGLKLSSKSPVDSAYTVRVKTFVEINLSRTVFKINALLYFTQ